MLLLLLLHFIIAYSFTFFLTYPMFIDSVFYYTPFINYLSYLLLLRLISSSISTIYFSHFSTSFLLAKYSNNFFLSFPTFYMFVIAYLPRWLSLTTRVVKVNHKGD